MRLWTIQPIEVWEEIQQTGIYRCNPMLTALDMDDEYKWMIRKMVDRIGPPPEGVQYPVWAWYKQNGKHHKPDLRSARWGYGPGDEDYACIEIEVPAEKVLLSDFDVWHIILNHGLISETEEDRKQEALFGAMDSNQQMLYRDKNWERVFDISPFRNDWITRGDWVQATFWELQKENVRSVRFFRTAGRKNLDSRQIYFVNQIVEYIVRNGMMKDLSVLQQPPFTDKGNIVELFSTSLGVWNGIRKAIERVNANAMAA